MSLKDLYFSETVEKDRLKIPEKYTCPVVVVCDTTNGEFYVATAIVPTGMPSSSPANRVATAIEEKDLFYFEDRMGLVKDHILTQKLSELRDRSPQSAARVTATYSRYFGKPFPRGAAENESVPTGAVFQPA